MHDREEPHGPVRFRIPEPERRDRILALDLALRCGWAVGEQNGTVLESGTQDFNARRGESPGLRYLHFRHWLEGLLSGGHGIGLVVFEMPHLRGGAAATLLTGLQTRIEELCAIAGGIEHAPVHTSTLKKFATGNGGASKEAMIAAARVVLGREPVDDNEADAVHILRWAAKEYGKA